MRISLGTARALRMGLVPLALGALIAVGYALSSGGEAAAQSSNRAPQLRMFSSARDCTRPPREFWDLDDGRYQNSSAIRIAAMCARKSRGNSEQIAYAQFFGGKARRILAERGQPCPHPDTGAEGPSGQCFVDAEVFLSAARGTSDLALSNRARLERARVLRLQRNYPAADAELTALNSRDVPVLYEQAMIILGSLANTAEGPSSAAAGAEATQNARMTAYRLLQAGFSGEVTSPEYAYVAAAGPLQLARLANDMGKEDLESALAERVSIAQDRFIVAQTAIGFVREHDDLAAKINFNSGRAQMRLAALRASPPREECQETPSGAEPISTSGARVAFVAARDRRLADAHWGLGCALLANKDFPAAIAEFTQAIPGPGTATELPRSEYHLGLARAQFADGRTNRVSWGNPSLPVGQEGGALASYRNALNAEANSERRERIRLELADVYRVVGDSLRAESTYDEVLRGARNADLRAEAQYQLGLLLAARGETAAARIHLARASTTSGQPWQAPASYELSKLEEQFCTRGRYCPGARQAADRAVNSAGAEDRERYRRQACQVRIRFRMTNEQGQAFCMALDGSPPNLLYEGMFWLVEANNRRGGQQQDAWSAALQSFQRGHDALASGPDAEVDGESLRELLSYGRRIVLHCGGLGSADTSSTRPSVRQFFENNGIVCNAAR